MGICNWEVLHPAVVEAANSVGAQQCALWRWGEKKRKKGEEKRRKKKEKEDKKRKRKKKEKDKKEKASSYPQKLHDLVWINDVCQHHKSNSGDPVTCAQPAPFSKPASKDCTNVCEDAFYSVACFSYSNLDIKPKPDECEKGINIQRTSA